MIGIYKILSPSGRVYIGQTWNSGRRFSNYRNLYCKYQTKLYNSLKKYGPENHIIGIIYELPIDVSQEIMDEYEKLYVEQYKSCGIELLNLREPGSRGKHTEEAKEKMRKPRKLPRTQSHINNNTSQKLKPILQFDLENNFIKEWDCAKLACQIYGIGVNFCLSKKNRQKTCKGFIWKHKYKVNNKGLTINQYKNLINYN